MEVQEFISYTSQGIRSFRKEPERFWHNAYESMREDLANVVANYWELIPYAVGGAGLGGWFNPDGNVFGDFNGVVGLAGLSLAAYSFRNGDDVTLREARDFFVLLGSAFWAGDSDIGMLTAGMAALSTEGMRLFFDGPYKNE